MSLPDHVASVLAGANDLKRPTTRGRVVGTVGLALEVSGLRGGIGDHCTVHTSGGRDMPAEIVGFRGDTAVVMSLAEQEGIAAFDAVTGHGRPLRVTTGPCLLGRVIDGLGNPIDGGPPLRGAERAVTNRAPAPLSRRPITASMQTGVSALDGFATCGLGQRIGIFAGSGVGKSTLLGMIARGCSTEVNVIALIGERGREVGDFIRDVLGPEGMARSVVVVATSDTPPMQRFKGPYVAVAIAEAFRDAGQDVLFMMDSVTRFASAAREIGLAAGEPPTLRGFPPSLFAQLPRLVERLGSSDVGSITGLLTVLVDGDDFNEPVSDALRGHLDGHVVLSRSIAHRGRYPAIDVLGSVSRLMPKVASEDHIAAANAVRELLAHYEENRDLVSVGAYRQGADPQLDRALQRMDDIENLLRQGPEPRDLAETVARLTELGQ